MTKSIKNDITLKEAAEISGYSQDYIGQLIRMGKLPGKQIYYNVAWVTTEEALRGYMNRSRANRPGRDLIADFFQKSQYPMLRFFVDGRFDKTMKFFMYVGIFITTALTLLSFYILTASLENKLEKRALHALIIEGSQLYQDEK